MTVWHCASGQPDYMEATPGGSAPNGVVVMIHHGGGNESDDTGRLLSCHMGPRDALSFALEVIDAALLHQPDEAARVTASIRLLLQGVTT